MKVFSTFVVFINFTIVFINTDNPDSDWMQYIKDDQSLDKINIPGTHDSGTAKVDYPTFSKTQCLSIKSQLTKGIRYLDIRIKLDNDDDDILINHDVARCFIPKTDLGLKLKFVFENCIDFLKDHPTEVVIIHLKIENSETPLETMKNKISTYIEENSSYFVITNTSFPTLDPNAKYVWIYNPSLNECLIINNKVKNETQEKPIKPLIKPCSNLVTHVWYIDSLPKGYFRSYVNPNKCMYLEDITSGKLKVDTCDINKNVVFEYTDDGLIKSPLSPNECLSKGDREETSGNTTNGYLNPCIGSEKQVWQLWDIQPNTLFEAKTQNVWVYKPELNKCLVSGNKLTNRPQIGNYDNSDSSKWQIPESENGFYKSLKTGWYLDVIDIDQGTIIMSDTRCPSSFIKHSKKKQAIISSLNSKKCLRIISSTNKNEYRLTLNDCNC